MTKGEILSWAIAQALQVGLLAILVRRTVYREFPLFFVYVLSVIVIETLRLAVSGNYLTYFKVYWATEALFSLLALLALHEVFRRVFILFYLYWWFWLIFPGTVGIITGITIWGTLHHPPAQAPPVVTLILSFGMAANYVQALLFGLFFVMVIFMELPWRHQAFGIVQGFGIAALGALLAFGIRSVFGNKFNLLAQYGPPVAYIVAVASWLFAFLAPEDQELTDEWAAAINPDHVMAQVRQYTEILREFLRRHDTS